MFKKLLSAFLCLTLMLCAPLMSLAATEATLTVAPGPDMAANAAVKDLFDALAIRVLTGEGAGSLSLDIGGKEALSVAAHIDESGLYVQNQALGDKPVFVGWLDLMAKLGDVFKTSASSASMPDFTKMSELVTDVMSLIPAGADLSAIEKAETMPEALAAFKELFKDDEKMTALIDEWIARIKVTDGDFTSDRHDPATQKWELALTGDDYLRVCDSQFVRKVLDIIVKAAVLGGEKDVPSTDKLLAEMKEAFQKTDIAYSFAVFTANEGKDLVSMEIATTVKGQVKDDDDDELEKVDVATHVTYDRLQKDGGTIDAFEMSMKDENEVEMAVRLLKTVNAEGGKRGVFGMLLDDTQFSFVLESGKAGDVTVTTFAPYIRSDAEALLDIAASDNPLFTLRLEVKPGDASALDSLKAATPDGSVQPVNFTETELNAYIKDTATRAQQLLYTLLGMLPTSVLEGMGTIAK